MKIVIFNAGLGNQIFTFLFSEYLKFRYPDHSLYGCYWSGGLKTHCGLEIDKVFNIELPRRSFFTDLIGKSYRILQRFGFRQFIEKHECNSWNIVFDYNRLDRKYYKDIDLKTALPFRYDCIDERNSSMATEMQNCCSVAVHIRRGDYMSKEHYLNFGKFCSEDYYRQAIARIKKLYPHCRLYFFSDDMEYVRTCFTEGVFIDWNYGNDSWKDMFLMSQCRHHIIANSTFSYWGAMLAHHDNQTVIAPKKWFIWENPDIFPEEWERM